ncbi:hypothetical protein U472_01100 [Orenia metallireducens]|uniref:PNPLA domain-containing protein n=1 Tax=Orenia metallireducens TaxID=1413210 RepID=A0A1C0AD20_9FIRM|nr:patatin-like phospholipase family protein [Orenia metallireducens]OCL28515.1 hypothetical protein U472_01100 [Orenia metallireducens]
MKINKLRINLSLSGGGIKGIAHLGGIKALEEDNIEIVGIAGSSAGAIIAALYGAGYNCEELKAIMYEHDFDEFKDNFSLIRLARNYGLYQGKSVLKWMRSKLASRGIRTFKDFDKDVNIIASNVNYKRPKVFSKGYTPNVSVAEAVRMSMSIPVLYVPYYYKSNLYVDGGVMNNLPLKVFNRSRLPCLGFMLVEEVGNRAKKINGFIEYLSAIMEMIIIVNEQRQIELSRSHIIAIPTGKIRATDFSLGKEDKDWLYNSGYTNAKKKLEYFKDRRLRKGIATFKGIEDIDNIKGTLIELEEFAEEMIDFLKFRIEISSFDTIISFDSDDYLFSYFVAQKLNKRFTVINQDKENIEYRYSQIRANDKAIILNFKNNPNAFLDILNNDKICSLKLKGIFSFIKRQKDDVRLLEYGLISDSCYNL